MQLPDRLPLCYLIAGVVLTWGGVCTLLHADNWQQETVNTGCACAGTATVDKWVGIDFPQDQPSQEAAWEAFTESELNTREGGWGFVYDDFAGNRSRKYNCFGYILLSGTHKVTTPDSWMGDLTGCYKESAPGSDPWQKSAAHGMKVDKTGKLSTDLFLAKNSDKMYPGSYVTVRKQ
jgi:hypothetical protein